MGDWATSFMPRTPLGKETDYRYFLDEVPGWISQVQNLLECHKVYLYHHPEEFYLIRTFARRSGSCKLGT